MHNYIDQRISKKIIQLIKNYKITSLLVAVSGGQDSLCLMKIIKKNILCKKIEYIYIDHQWKKDSKLQIEYLIKYCKSLKIDLSIYQIKDISLSENLSRTLRYHILISHAMKKKHNAIITAHSKTDRLETFLYNLIRGTGLEGTTTLNLHRKLNNKISIFRPLIQESRSEINFFCKQWILPIWSDITNYNYNITRNKIRYELSPYIKKYLNNNFENNIINYLHSFYHENEYIKQKTFKLYILIKHKNYIALNHHYINNQHIALKIRILQIFIYHNFYIVVTKKILFSIIKRIDNIKYNQKIYYKHLIFYINTKWIYIK